MIRAVKYDPHDRLPRSNWTISLNMHLINTNCLTFMNKGIEHIFTEVFALDDHLFLLSMPLWIKSCQSIYTISLLTDPRGDGSWVETEHASASDDTNLWSFWNKDCEAFSFKLAFDVSFEVWTL